MATTILDDKKKNTAVDTNKPKGVSDSAWEGTKETFSVSNSVNDAKTNMDSATNKYTSHIENDKMISSSTQSALKTSFEVPSAVTEADAWLSTQLEKIQSGKTSYSDQVREMMDKIMNREKFSYDVDTDPLFQQALASAMNSGKIAMQDTIGQASALTAGYGSTYATTAGNQAYNSFIEDAYDNLLQYYQMALEAYQMEGDEMYRQYSMLSTEDEKEYNRNVTAYDATYQYRNQLYNEAYNQFRDKKSDAFATANLEMQQYAQESSDLYNLYSIASNAYESMYEKEYQSWADRINNAWKTVEAETTDWQNQTNRDFQASESQKQREWQSAEAEKERAFTASENAKNRAASRSGGGSGGSGSGGNNGYSPSAKQKEDALNEYVNGGSEALYSYMDSQKGGMNAAELMQYVEDMTVPSGTTVTKTKNTWNGFLGIGGLTGHIDTNDEYTITYPDGTKKEGLNAGDLPELIRARVDDLKQGKSITW